MIAATDAALDCAKEGDWLVIDMVDKVWEYAQAHFVHVMHGVDMDAYLTSIRQALPKDKKNLKPFEGLTDWPTINGIYRGWSDRTLMNDRGIHIFGVSPMKAIDGRLTGEDMKEMFGNLGVYPAGQKHLAHQFHTVLLMSQAKGNLWKADTAKDRERPFLKGKIGDFAADYMVAVAGFAPQPQDARAAGPPRQCDPTPPPTEAVPEKTPQRLDTPLPEEPLFNPDGTPANQAAAEYEPSTADAPETAEMLEIAEGLLERDEVPGKYAPAIEDWCYLRTWLSTTIKMKPRAQDALRVATVGEVEWADLTAAQRLVIAWAAETETAKVSA